MASTLLLVSVSQGKTNILAASVAQARVLMQPPKIGCICREHLPCWNKGPPKLHSSLARLKLNSVQEYAIKHSGLIIKQGYCTLYAAAASQLDIAHNQGTQEDSLIPEESATS